MKITNEQLNQLAKDSIEYFQSTEKSSNDKEFWRECKELSKEWLDLLNRPDLTFEAVKPFNEKLEALNRKDCSHWLLHITNIIQMWISDLSSLR